MGGVYGAARKWRNLLSQLTFGLLKLYYRRHFHALVYVMFEGLTSVDVRVRYAETDQMGVAHHANYLIWCELARTRHMAQLGVSYRDLEESGLRLPVTEAHLRYRAPARYDDLLSVQCWVRDVRSRRVEFGYVVVRQADDMLLATARISLTAVDSNHVITTIPGEVRELIAPVPDPIRL